MPRIISVARLYTGFLDPRRCPVCSRIVLPRGRLICPGCMEKLAWVRRPVCKCCGKEVVSDTVEYFYDCTKPDRSFRFGMALINYNEIAGRSMARIKYHGCRGYMPGLSGLLSRSHASPLRPGHFTPFSRLHHSHSRPPQPPEKTRLQPGGRAGCPHRPENGYPPGKRFSETDKENTSPKILRSRCPPEKPGAGLRLCPTASRHSYRSADRRYLHHRQHHGSLCQSA